MEDLGGPSSAPTPKAKPQLSEAIGHTFSGIGIRSEGSGEQAALSPENAALTGGSDLFFRAPEIAAGAGAAPHIAHEAAHVVQQSPAAGLSGELASAGAGAMASLPENIVSTGMDILSQVLPSPSGIARDVGETVHRAQHGVESVIDPVLGGIGRAAQWGGEQLEGILGMGESIGERAVGGFGGAPLMRDSSESELE